VVQERVCGRDTGGAAVTGFCELISTDGVDAAAVTPVVNSAAQVRAITNRIRRTEPPDHRTGHQDCSSTRTDDNQPFSGWSSL
jgi:hypothetical protein